MLIELLLTVGPLVFGLSCLIVIGNYVASVVCYQHTKRFVKNNLSSHKYIEISFKHFQEFYAMNPSVWIFSQDNVTIYYKGEFEVYFHHYYELYKYKRWLKKKTHIRGELEYQKNQAQFINLIQKDINDYRDAILRDLSRGV